MSTEIPTPSDTEFRYIGLDERQIRQLSDQPNHLRAVVYETALEQMMGTGPGYGSERPVNI